MEANKKSKKDIQNYIRQELGSILLTINPAIDKKDFKKSIKQAAEILYEAATKKRKKPKPVEIMSTTEVKIIPVE